MRINMKNQKPIIAECLRIPPIRCFKQGILRLPTCGIPAGVLRGSTWNNKRNYSQYCTDFLKLGRLTGSRLIS